MMADPEPNLLGEAITRNTTQCYSCGDDIVWTRGYESGKSMPVNPWRSKGGNVAVFLELDDKGREVLLNRVIHKDERGEYGDLHLSHFATCKHAKAHRRS